MATSNLYKTANKTRTKLLLFIDKEIQTRKKYNSKFIQKENPQCNSLIYLEETFSQIQPTRFYTIEINKNILYKKFKKYIENHQNSISKTQRTNKLEIRQNKRLEIHKNSLQTKTESERNSNIFTNTKDYKKICSTLNFNLIHLKEKVYSMKVKRKTSSVLEIYSKPKNDKKYLIELCNNLKIMRPKVNRQKSSTFLSKNLNKSKFTFASMAVTQSFKSFKRRNRCSVTCKNIDKNKEIKSKFKKKESLFKKFAKKNTLIPHNTGISLIVSKK